MINPAFKFALLIARGNQPKTAFNKIKHLLPPGERRLPPDEYAEKHEVGEWLQLFDDASVSSDSMRKELIVFFLDDSRNEGLPWQARQKARDSLMKLFGLEQQKVSITSDEDFREFLLNAGSSPSESSTHAQ